VNEDIIYDIIASNDSPDEAASLLVEEAINKEAEDNMTAMIIKVERTESAQIQPAGPRTTQFRSARSGKLPARLGNVPASARRRSIDFGKLISMAVLVVLAAAVLFGGFKLWERLRNPESLDASSQQETTLTAADGSTSADSSTLIDETDIISQPGGDGNVTDGAISPDTDGSSASDEGENSLVGPDGTTHVVKAGDMLMKISKKYYGDENKYKIIMEANNITDPNKIAVGQTLKIPPLE
jgi:nucleoid-associated protein YgaU